MVKCSMHVTSAQPCAFRSSVVGICGSFSLHIGIGKGFEPLEDFQSAASPSVCKWLGLVTKDLL
jgi:hypothetical protein